MKNRVQEAELELRKRIRETVRALGRPLSAETTDLIDSILGPWQRSESIQRIIAGLPARETDGYLAACLEYSKLRKKREMQRKQLGSAASRRGNLAERNRWVCEEFAQRKNRHRDQNYSPGAFHRDLDNGRIPIPRKFAKSLKPNGEIITMQGLKKIIEAGRRLAASRNIL